MGNDGLQRSSKVRKIPTKLKDYVYNTVWHSTKSHSSLAPPIFAADRGKSMCPLMIYVTCYKFSDKHKHFLAYVTADFELTQFADIVSNPKWREAMKLEIDVLEKNGTWELIQLSIRKCALDSKWIYKIKYKVNGSVECTRHAWSFLEIHKRGNRLYGDLYPYCEDSHSPKLYCLLLQLEIGPYIK